MRNTWGTYVAHARRTRGLNRTEFATAAGVGRTTAWRWEKSDQRPESVEVVRRVADVLGVDLDEALAAAGLRPSADPPAEPRTQEPPRDPEIAELERRLADPDVSEEEKAGYRALLRYAVQARGGRLAVTEEDDRAHGQGRVS